MKKLALLFALLLLPTAASAQTSGVAYRLRGGTAAPPATCRASAPVDLYYRTSTDIFYVCTTPNTWTIGFTAGGAAGGDVVGPASATDNAVVRFNLTTGKLVQNSAVTIADSTGDVTTPGVYKAGDGGVSSASFQFGTEATLGFFRRGAGQLGVTSGSSTVGWFDATGWHGFGTAVETFNDSSASADGVILTTNGNATVGVQKLSPRLRFSGSGWKTDATAAARMTDWIVENQPVQGTADPSANLVFSSQINNGGYTPRVTFKSGGDVDVPGVLTVGSCTGCGGTFATPAANSVGIAAPSAGVATSYPRSDATFQLDQSIAPTWTGVHFWQLSSANALAIGPNGNTNPVLRVVTNTASQADGVSVDGRAAGSGTLFTGLSSGSDAGFTFLPKGNVGKFLIKPTASGGFGNAVFEIQESNGVQILDIQRGNGHARLDVASACWTTQASNDCFSDNGGLFLKSTNEIAWGSSGAYYNGQDLWAGRAGAANFRIGRANAASPIAQTLSVQNVIAGTSNTAGATFSHVGSQSTGTGLPGRLSLQTSGLSATSATTVNALVSRLELGATKLLTNNTNTAIVNVTVASNTVASGIVEYSVEVFDGTDLQLETGSFIYQVTNKGGALANNTITFPTGFPKNVTTSGTLTCTWTITAADPGVLTLNANSSLTPSTNYPRVTYAIRNLTQQAIAVQ